MIKFGTDGWRAIMCEDFTFPNVRLVVQGICNYLKGKKLPSKIVVVGYDTRMFSDKFAKMSARVLAANGFKAYLPEKDCPTPVTAFSIGHLKAAGALMFTASHNPAEYNGIKFIPHNMSPAMPDVTDKIEKEIIKIAGKNKINIINFEDGLKKKKIIYFDPKPAYIRKIKSKIDTDIIKKAKLKAVYDPMYGTGRGYVESVLGDLCKIDSINNYRDVEFGGRKPEPSGENLKDLVRAMKKDRADIGLANDGDADRFGIVDSDGTYINANFVISILLMHLLKNKGWRGPVARTVATTHLIDRIAEIYKIKVIETPVGFKYIGQALREKGAILGGEESGGLSIKGHIPEKDGVLAVSLMAEVRAFEKKTFKQILKGIMKKTGTVYNKR
ncbi:MAG: phosphoglucomutase/phosphomannomutase family protein, partial [Armatimonadota bacterium]